MTATGQYDVTLDFLAYKALNDAQMAGMNEKYLTLFNQAKNHVHLDLTPWDDLGDNDNARADALNKLMRPGAVKIFEDYEFIGVRFPIRDITIDDGHEFELWDDLYAVSDYWPAREYGTACRLIYTGKSYGFKFVANKHGYPVNDTSPRNVTFRGVQLVGKWLPVIDPAAGNNYKNQTLWYCNFDGCGFINGPTAFTGYSTGTSFSGITHTQGITGPVFRVGGSETSINGGGGYSFGGSKNSSNFIESFLSKSSYGEIMTTQPEGIGIVVYNGFDVEFDKIRIDAQDSNPATTCGIRVLAGEAIKFPQVSIKGYLATDPGILGLFEVLGGNVDIGYLTGQYDTLGKFAAMPTIPLLVSGPKVKAGAVSLLCGRSTRANGFPPIVRESVKGQIVGPRIGTVSG